MSEKERIVQHLLDAPMVHVCIRLEETERCISTVLFSSFHTCTMHRTNQHGSSALSVLRGAKLGQCHYPRLGLLHDQFYVKRIALCQYHHHRQHVTNCYSGYVYNSSRLPLQGVSPSKTGATTPSTTTTSSPSPNSREAYLTSVSSKHCEDGT